MSKTDRPHTLQMISSGDIFLWLISKCLWIVCAVILKCVNYLILIDNYLAWIK